MTHILHSRQTPIATKQIKVRSSGFVCLVARRNDGLGKGESEAIALGLEMQTDYFILDDLAARKEKEAMRLGLNVKVTLAIVKKLQAEGKIAIDSLDALYENISEINFRVKRSGFDAIFKN